MVSVPFIVQRPNEYVMSKASNFDDNAWVVRPALTAEIMKSRRKLEAFVMALQKGAVMVEVLHEIERGGVLESILKLWVLVPPAPSVALFVIPIHLLSLGQFSFCRFALRCFDG